MTALRVFFPLLLAVCVALSSSAQSKRDTGSKRTDEKGTAGAPAKAESRGSDRKPAKDKYDPLPHDPPITRPVDVNYPPFVYLPVSSPPVSYPVYVDGPGPAQGYSQRPHPGRQRKVVQVELDDCMDHSDSAGYSFTREQVVSCEDSTVDIYLSTTAPDSAYFMVPQDNDIKDIGPHESLYDVIRFRPRDWAEAHAALLTPGHVYVVWTYNGDFVLVRALDVGERHVAFEWVRHSHLLRTTAAEAEKRQKEKDAEEAKRRENLGPYFTK